LASLAAHLRPRSRPAFPSGIEDDRGRVAPYAIEIEPKSVYQNEQAGLRTKGFAGDLAAAD